MGAEFSCWNFLVHNGKGDCVDDDNQRPDDHHNVPQICDSNLDFYESLSFDEQNPVIKVYVETLPPRNHKFLFEVTFNLVQIFIRLNVIMKYLTQARYQKQSIYFMS